MPVSPSSSTPPYRSNAAGPTGSAGDVRSVDGGRVSESAAVGRVQSHRDQVQVSASARVLGRAVAAVQAAPEVDTAAISAIQLQIAGGAYQVDPATIAQAMLRRGPA